MKNISLVYRFVLWFIVVALLPLASFGYLSLQQNETALRSEMLNRMSHLADKKTLQIQTYLAERMQNVQLLARSSLVEAAMADLLRAYTHHRVDSAEYRSAEKPFRKNFAAYIGEDKDTLFYDVFLITPQGEIVYTHEHEPDFATNLLSGPYRDSQLAQAFRESCMALGSSISSFEHYAPSGVPAAFISAPIIREGVLLGVVAFQLDTQRIYRVASDNNGLGATGETVLAKLTGAGEAVFVAPLRHDPQAAMQRKIDLKKMAVPMRYALAGQRGKGVEIDYAGKQVVAAWRYLPELRWGMVVKMDTDEAFAPLRQQRKKLLEALLALAILGGFVAFYFGRQMVMRLRNFARNADEIAQGDLSKRVNESGRDEIGVLARSFNRMTGNLQALYRSLEGRVEERTRELRESEASFRQLFERHSAVMLLIDHQSHIIVDANPAAAQFYGYPLEILRGMNVSRINAQPESEIHQQRQQAITGEQNRFGFYHRLANGVVRAVEVHISTVNYKGKSLFFSIIHDITERKLAEEQLRVAAATFETHEAILITDANANIIRVNRAFQDITGYTPEEVLGKNPRILSSGREGKAFYTAMWQQLLTTDTWIGEIWDRRKGGQVYPKWMTISAVKNEKGETTEYVAIFSDISERKQAETEIRNLAFYDALTSLPNRRLLLDRLHLALSVSARSHHYGAILFLDMDKFKVLNDTLGHDYGDLMLIDVAQRIQSCLREMDTVARLGGDEFVVLIEEVDANAEEASQKVALIAEKIRVSLATPYLLKGHEYHSSPSIGVCLYKGNQESIDTLLKHADLAMYQVKDSGRNAVRFFDPAMQHAVETHAALESDLRRALPNHELHLYYQMQVDSENRPLGAEALLRWIHPQRGMVSPAQFIPIAEEGSLILDIGLWVLETACRQLALWDENEQMRNLELAVNVSAQQFRKHDFVETVATVARVHQIDPARLKLELTESVVLSDVTDVVTKMHALKALGIKLALDDFGTGYSSLSYLKKLPLDQIKIDQSFVRDIATDPSDAVMVQTIIDLAHNFRLNVIAEGVETEAQLDFLKRNGCRAYQGYLFGKPMPLDLFEQHVMGLINRVGG
ncbi:MAG: EAL domain-containing protein [Aequorivita sp.]|nr:EAL domain-containing protein [Aequorivita sp.]